MRAPGAPNEPRPSSRALSRSHRSAEKSSSAKPTESNTVTCSASLAARRRCRQHAPQLGDGEVGRHLLDVALDARLRLVFDEHPRPAQHVGVQLGLARAVATDGVDVHAGLDHVRREDRGACLVGGDGGDDVGAAHRLARCSCTAADLSPAYARRLAPAWRWPRRSMSNRRISSMPSRWWKASAWNSLCAPLPISAIVAAAGPRQRSARPAPRWRRCAARWSVSARSAARAGRWPRRPARRRPSRWAGRSACCPGGR